MEFLRHLHGKLLGPHSNYAPEPQRSSGFRLFCGAAYDRTGRAVHLSEVTNCTTEGELRPSDVWPRLACDFRQSWGEPRCGLQQTEFGLVWQGEAGSEQLRRCLEDPQCLNDESSCFPMPIHVAPCADRAEGCDTPELFGPEGPCESDGTALLFVVASRFNFPASKVRTYAPFYDRASTNEDIRSAKLAAGFDTHVVRSRGHGHPNSWQLGFLSDYELVVMGARQLLPIAAVDFVREPARMRPRPPETKLQAPEMLCRPERSARPSSANCSSRPRRSYV